MWVGCGFVWWDQCVCIAFSTAQDTRDDACGAWMNNEKGEFERRCVRVVVLLFPAEGVLRGSNILTHDGDVDFVIVHPMSYVIWQLSISSAQSCLMDPKLSSIILSYSVL